MEPRTPGAPRPDPAPLDRLREEITDPVTAIDAEAQLLLSSDAGLRSPEVRDSAHRIISHCRRIATLLQDPPQNSSRESA